ncbi:MAG: amidase [SAR324 cluster bacterium]|nr:amidase [SAR324 cluster bacterium]
MSEELHWLSAVELLRAYRSRRLSPVEVTRALLERIERLNPRLNAFCRVDGEGALEAARISEARWARGEPVGLLDGVPVSLKDVVLVKGFPTLYGSKTVDPDQPWDEDGPAAARLREHGAVLLGKTCTPEFGHRFTTDSPLTGITRNPWNPERSPGGSSGGAGAALAAGLGPLAIGSDGGGSIRIPSAWCGVVGFKPTFGRVPAYPASRWGTLSNVGPLARSVEDAVLLFTVITEPDARDWYALPPDPRDYRIGLEEGVRGLRIAFSPDMGLATVEPAIAAAVEAAVGLFSELGAEVERVEPPGIGTAPETYTALKGVMLTQALAAMTPEQREVADPILVELAEPGTSVPARDYQRALLQRQEIGATMHAFLNRYDLLLTPSFHFSPLPVPGLPAELRSPLLTSWVNQTMQPAASVPCGLTAENLPVGLQIVGPRYADARVLRAARAYESARGTFARAPV